MKIGIAGAGLLGRLFAWRMLRAGHDVTLFDPDGVEGERAAARVAAAMLAPYSEAVSSERQIFDWGCDALRRWPSLLAELAEDAAPAVFYQQCGSVVVAHRNDMAMLPHFERLLRQRIPDRWDEVRRLDGAALADLEPELDRFDSGLLLAHEGTLDNRELLARLAEAIAGRGGCWRERTAVEKVLPGRLVLADSTFACDLAVDTRGLGARSQQPQLRGVRGEVLWVEAPEVRLRRPVRLMHPRYQLYVAPKRERVYVIGATEIESDSLAPITVRSSLELQSALYSLHGGFAEANILHAYANCRPAYPDNLPRLERSAGRLMVNGLYRHGYLLAPVLLDLMCASVDDMHVAHPMVATGGG